MTSALPHLPASLPNNCVMKNSCRSYWLVDRSTPLSGSTARLRLGEDSRHCYHCCCCLLCSCVSWASWQREEGGGGEGQSYSGMVGGSMGDWVNDSADHLKMSIRLEAQTKLDLNNYTHHLCLFCTQWRNRQAEACCSKGSWLIRCWGRNDLHRQLLPSLSRPGNHPAANYSPDSATPSWACGAERPQHKFSPVNVKIQVTSVSLSEHKLYCCWDPADAISCCIIL